MLDQECSRWCCNHDGGEARRKTGAVPVTTTPTVRQERPTSRYAMCCDSFA